MTTYTDDQVLEQLAKVLAAARTQGEVRIRAKDGREYTVRPVCARISPFDIPGVDLNMSASEIVGVVREGRER